MTIIKARIFMIDYIAIGKRVAGIRKMSKMSQKEAASFLGISKGSLCKIENGLVKTELDMLFKISRLFRCDIDWLLWGVFL